MVRSMKGEMMRLLGIASVLFGILASGTAWAAKEVSPEDAAKAAMISMKKGDWAAYTHQMHPEALAKAKQMFRSIVAADATGRTGEVLFGVGTPKAYDALSDSASFVALMTHLTQNFPALDEAMRTSEFHVIGTLREGENLVHIVYRADASAEDVTITKTAVLTMRRHRDEWRMLLTGNIEGLASRLSQMTGAKR